MKKKYFLVFIFYFLFFIFFGFSIQFPNPISKVSSLCSAKDLSYEDLKFVDPVFQGIRKALIFTSNAIILQSMWSTFLKKFPHLILIVQSKLVQLNLKKSKSKSIYAIYTKSGNFGVFFS
jgi:hypothetical protein